jgi:autotransporter family porin
VRRHALLSGAIAGLLVVASGGAVVAVRHAATSNAPNRAGSPVAAGRALSTSSPSETPTATPSPTATPTAAATPAPAKAPSTQLAAAPAHFGTLAPGAALPSGAQCAAWVRAKPLAENKGGNRGFNQATGHSLGGSFFPTSDDARSNRLLAVRVDGQFTGTTHEILRWAACKWGIDEDIVAAQAAVESWWNQTTKGDLGSDPTACPPGHGLGADGTPGQCPQSYGILQNRYPFEQASWPGIGRSTAMNADTAYANWRTCFEGYELWLNNVERGRAYGAGDAWGCVGRWFAGRWHTAPAEGYIGKVQGYLNQRIWEQASFQQP